MSVHFRRKAAQLLLTGSNGPALLSPTARPPLEGSALREGLGQCSRALGTSGLGYVDADLDGQLCGRGDRRTWRGKVGRLFPPFIF
jgi:hypothetical protein